MKKLFLSVIIPTCNRNDLLKRCLDKLSPSFQNLDYQNYEVIVSDDSKDESTKWLLENEYKWIRWLQGPKKGPAANRNNGAKYANGNWLIFIDDDCLPSAELLSKYYNVIKEDKYKALEGAILNERVKQRFDEEAPLNLSGGNFWSCNIAIDKEVFWQINGFDEGFPFPAMEDVDLHIRVKKKATIMFIPSASVIHPWRRVKPFTNFKKHLQSHIYITKKFGSSNSITFKMKRVKLFIVCALLDFKSLAKFSFKGWKFYIEKTMLNFCLIFIG